MTDVYVYQFTGWDRSTESDVRSTRRATLETIKAIGDPIMESQIVVDDAELDANGFFCGSVANDSHPAENVRNEIKSLNLRAASRDSEALTLPDDAAGAARKYMLQLESRELRKQAKRLQSQSDVATAQSDDQADALRFAQFDATPTAG